MSKVSKPARAGKKGVRARVPCPPVASPRTLDDVTRELTTYETFSALVHAALVGEWVLALVVVPTSRLVRELARSAAAHRLADAFDRAMVCLDVRTRAWRLPWPAAGEEGVVRDARARFFEARRPLTGGPPHLVETDFHGNALRRTLCGEVSPDDLAAHPEPRARCGTCKAAWKAIAGADPLAELHVPDEGTPLHLTFVEPTPSTIARTERLLAELLPRRREPFNDDDWRLHWAVAAACAHARHADGRLLRLREMETVSLDELGPFLAVHEVARDTRSRREVRHAFELRRSPARFEAWKARQLEARAWPAENRSESPLEATQGTPEPPESAVALRRASETHEDNESPRTEVAS